jgi:serine/threonine protein kinase
MTCDVGTHIANEIEKYQFGRCLGSGGAGKVFAASCKESGLQVAIKVVAVSCEEQRHEALQEAAIMAALDHPHICKL